MCPQLRASGKLTAASGHSLGNSPGLGVEEGGLHFQKQHPVHRGRPEDRARGLLFCGPPQAFIRRPEGLQLGRFSAFLTCIYSYSLNEPRGGSAERDKETKLSYYKPPPSLPKVARPLEGM